MAATPKPFRKAVKKQNASFREQFSKQMPKHEVKKQMKEMTIKGSPSYKKSLKKKKLKD